MKMGQGVEWSIHCCALLAAVPEERALRLEKIAEFYDLPVPYLRKHFQALSRAGIVKTSPGPGGGYRLAKPAAEINLLDIYWALEGKEPAFRCNEIRQQGATACKGDLYPVACNIATSMWRAEEAWRKELKNVSISDIVAVAANRISDERKENSRQWLEEALSKE